MRIQLKVRSESRTPPPRRHPSTAGFTMVEIAISLGVVAFALVAIVGVLPTGFKAQRENREETIINQEGTLWLEAIRGGAIGLDYLTNHVDYIERVDPGVGTINYFTNHYNARDVSVPGPAHPFFNGRDIIGLLTVLRSPQNGSPTNLLPPFARAYVRAISGSAADKAPQNDTAFQYRMTVEVAPYYAAVGMSTNFTETLLSPSERSNRSNLWLRTSNLQSNLFDVRVGIEWPVIQAVTGRRLPATASRKEFRTLASGTLVATNGNHIANRLSLYLLQPSEFQRIQ